MSRKRSISSDLVTDPAIEELAEHGTLPCLLYTWAIPHADDWGRLPGDARQFRLLVCPALRVTAAEVNEAIDQIQAVGLWQRYEVNGSFYIAFPKAVWFKHQSYIDHKKREDDKSHFPPPPAEHPHKTPQNATNLQKVAPSVPSPSPTPSPTPSPSPSPTPIRNNVVVAETVLTTLQVVCQKLGISKSRDAEELVERAMQLVPDTDHISRALSCKGYYGDAWSGKKEMQRASHYKTWSENDKADIERKAKTALAAPKPQVENLGHRTPNAIPRDTVAHSPIPEWDTILQVFINERKCSREDFQRFMLGVTPSPVVDGILPISVPEELYLYMSNTMGTKIRSVLGDLMPGIEARYDVAPRSVATA